MFKTMLASFSSLISLSSVENTIEGIFLFNSLDFIEKLIWSNKIYFARERFVWNWNIINLRFFNKKCLSMFLISKTSSKFMNWSDNITKSCSVDMFTNCSIFIFFSSFSKTKVQRSWLRQVELQDHNHHTEWVNRYNDPKCWQIKVNIIHLSCAVFT